MKLVNTITLGAALCVLPMSSSFAEWKQLGSNEAIVVYVDQDTIRVNGENAQIMSMLDFKKPGENPTTKKMVRSIIGLNEYNCPSGSYRPIEFKEFSGPKGTGDVVSDNKTPDSKFEAVENGGWSAGVFNVACKR